MQIRISGNPSLSGAGGPQGSHGHKNSIKIELDIEPGDLQDIQDTPKAKHKHGGRTSESSGSSGSSDSLETTLLKFIEKLLNKLGLTEDGGDDSGGGGGGEGAGGGDMGNFFDKLLRMLGLKSGDDEESGGGGQGQQSPAAPPPYSPPGGPAPVNSTPAPANSTPAPTNGTPAPVGDTTTSGGNGYEDLTAAAAKKYGVPQKLIDSVIKQESNGDPNAVNGTSGCTGLMQLDPRFFGQDGANLKDPATNIDRGTKELARLFAVKGGDMVATLAAYNLGEFANIDTTVPGQNGLTGRQYAEQVLART
jgi:hypothetical protein